MGIDSALWGEENSFTSYADIKAFNTEEKVKRFPPKTDPFNGYSPKIKQRILDAINENESFISQFEKCVTVKQLQTLISSILDTKLHQVVNGKQLQKLIYYAESLGARAVIKTSQLQRYEDILIRNIVIQQSGIVLIQSDKMERRLQEPFGESKIAEAMTFRVVCVM